MEKIIELLRGWLEESEQTTDSRTLAVNKGERNSNDKYHPPS